MAEQNCITLLLDILLMKACPASDKSTLLVEMHAQAVLATLVSMCMDLSIFKLHAACGKRGDQIENSWWRC